MAEDDALHSIVKSVCDLFGVLFGAMMTEAEIRDVVHLPEHLSHHW